MEDEWMNEWIEYEWMINELINVWVNEWMAVE